MNNNEKIKYDDEINLANLFHSIWIKKFKIIFVTIFAMMLMYGYLITKEPDKIIYKVSSLIKPISSFDESNYDNFNNFIQNSEVFLSDSNFIFNYQEYIEIPKYLKKRTPKNNIKSIDKIFLEKLFIEKINEESYLKNLLKDKFINKSDYETVSEYENEILRITSNFKLSPNDDDFGYTWKIKSQISNLNNWEVVLKLIEKHTNLIVQEYIKEDFRRSISHQKELHGYMVDNLETEIRRMEKLIIDEDIIDYFKLELSLMKQNKNFDRLENLFNLSPLAQDDFYAAKISLNSIKHEKIGKEISKKSLIFIAGLLGLVIGIIFVIISDEFLEKN